MQQYNNKNASVSQKLFMLSEHEHYCTMHEHYTLSLKEHRHHHHGASRCTVSHLISLCYLSISQSEKCILNVICRQGLSLYFLWMSSCRMIL